MLRLLIVATTYMLLYLAVTHGVMDFATALIIGLIATSVAMGPVRILKLLFGLLMIARGIAG